MKRLFAMLLAVLMMVAIAMPVFANSDAGSETEEVLSPTEQPKYKIDIYYDLDTIVYDGQVLVVPGDSYVFIPKEQDPKYIFDHIEISGSYTVTQDGDKYIITPTGDLVIHVKYQGKNPTPPPKDDGKESPNTGLPTTWLVLIAVIAVTGVVLSVRKLRKN